MLGLDAAGKTTILYKLHIGEVLSTVPTIGTSSPFLIIWTAVVKRTKFLTPLNKHSFRVLYFM